jgi:hypothetical protein
VIFKSIGERFMGRRWWQKEARRLQNEQAKAQEAASTAEEVKNIADAHFAVAEEAAVELAETVAVISPEDVDQVTMTAEQESIEDAKDAEIPVPVAVTQNQFVIDNNKKKRR